MTERGIIALAGYVPVHRIGRRAIATAMDWTSPTSPELEGTLAFGNWDEDSITMAVAAARRCGISESGANVDKVTLASTTLPFADRSNSGVVADALALPDSVITRDVGGSQRAATGALIDAVKATSTELIVAADKRRSRPGSAQELRYGHAGVACLVGEGSPVLRTLGSASVTADLVDHYRAAGAVHDYELESRWVRDEGHVTLLPKVIDRALNRAGIAPDQVAHAILPIPPGSARKVRQQVGLAATSNADDLTKTVGDAGVGQALLALDQMLPALADGDVVVLCGFGQGADALVLQRTDQIFDAPHDTQSAREETFYTRFLSLNDELDVDWGMRAERDNRTAQSVHYRRRDAISSFTGGRCETCGTPQYPRAQVCVSCQARGSQTPYRFADRSATVKSFTEDWQAYTRSPPLVYGNVQFEGGGNVYMEFTDVGPGELRVGDAVATSFRIKDIDRRRGFHRYFWKAVRQ